MLKEIADRWIDDGHTVDVVTSQPSYRASRTRRQLRKSDENGVRVLRLPLKPEIGRPMTRILNSIRLSLNVFVRAAAGRYDVVMVSTSPPVVLAFAAALGSSIGRARFLYHCMDLHPEIGQLSGEFRNPHVYKLLMMLDSFAVKRARPAVVLSDDMEASLRRRPSGGSFRVAIRNNFALTDETVSAGLGADGLAQRIWEESDIPEAAFVLIFAGNIGRFQGLENVIEGIARLHEIAPTNSVYLLFVGDGPCVERLRQRSLELGVAHVIKFAGLQTVSVARELIRLADVALVTLQTDVIKFAYPSKTATYADLGLPMLVVVEHDSGLARTIDEEELGGTAPPNDPIALAQQMLRLSLLAKQDLIGMGARATAFAAETFDKREAISWWSAEIEEEE